MPGRPLSIEAPESASSLDNDVRAVAAVLSGRRVVALTGAGCSTESGIPDYRGNGQPPARSPILHDAFVRRPEVRQRYWARATIGWDRFSGARPNGAHMALAAMERGAALRGIITQNVDRLHRVAGSVRVVELHGALSDVRCLVCARPEHRGSLHQRLLAANPGWLDHGVTTAPDGDAELELAEAAAFNVLGCRDCAGALMPDVVFFGGSVPEAKLASAWALVDEAEVLLVVGSSLTVYSGWRFVRAAVERGLLVAIVNLGPTRADSVCQVRVHTAAGTFLPLLADRLTDGVSRGV